MFQTIKDYIFNNQLCIDRGLYITVIIGQLTIYGILLTFYQFIASFQNDSRECPQSYLGRRIMEYFVYKKVKFFRAVKSKLFIFFFIMEILIMPILTIWGNYINRQVASIIIFSWYAFVIIFFLIFIVIFFQCTICVTNLKGAVDIERNKDIINNINQDFLKWYKSYTSKNNLADSLYESMCYLQKAIKLDNEKELNDEYRKLFYKIWKLYCIQKEKEIKRSIQTGKIVKGQIAYVYNHNLELDLLYSVVKGQYFEIDDKALHDITEMYLDLIYLNMVRGELEKGKATREDLFPKDRFSSRIDWEKLSVHIYEFSSAETRFYLVEQLYLSKHNLNEAFRTYSERIIKRLLEDSLSKVLTKKQSQEELLKVFHQILMNDNMQQVVSDNLCVHIGYNHSDVPDKIIKILNTENKIYVFCYLVLYFSIYRFRFGWKEININLLKNLVEEAEISKIDRGYILNRIKASCFEHRFHETMFDALMGYMKAPLTGLLIEKVHEEKLLDPFYIFVMKLCVLDQEYNYYDDKMPLDLMVDIFENLSGHPELTKDKRIVAFVYMHRYEVFSKLEQIPNQILASLKMLLLTDVRLNEEIYKDKKVRYIYETEVGKYTLIKLNYDTEISNNMKEIVRRAYMSGNCSVDEYLNDIEKVCKECCVNLSFVQKEKMKRYLLELI